MNEETPQPKPPRAPKVKPPLLLAPHQVQFILTILLVMAAFIIGVLWTRLQYAEKGSTTTTPTTKSQEQALPKSTNKPKEVTSQDHIRGNINAPIKWIEYSDLECPFCKRIHTDLKKLVDEYQGKVSWVYRHYPIDQLHPKARKEAEASECAASLGGNDGFWKFIDKVFEVTPSNNNLDESELPRIAGEIGLDVGKFNECLSSGKFTKKVQEDFDEGSKAGVTGTPGSFVVDKKGGATVVAGAQPYAQLKAAVDQALK